ncbi:unnamed protein product [Penicillium nalgiovense]|nr:unnamed protein product [Penicillium nalgiovense]CAG8337010.1 unnamed protein product [Penicillium nalgiovense]
MIVRNRIFIIAQPIPIKWTSSSLPSSIFLFVCPIIGHALHPIIVPSPPTPPGIGAPHVLAISHVLAIFPFLNH